MSYITVNMSHAPASIMMGMDAKVQSIATTPIMFRWLETLRGKTRGNVARRQTENASRRQKTRTRGSVWAWGWDTAKFASKKYGSEMFAVVVIVAVVAGKG